MEIDPKLRRELTKRFEMEANKNEVEITENWRRDLEAIYTKEAREHQLAAHRHKRSHRPHEHENKDADKHHKRGLTKMKYLVLSVVAVFLIASPLWGEPETGQKACDHGEEGLRSGEGSGEPEKGGRFSEDTRRPRPARSCAASSIPLEDGDIREDFEREFYQLIENKGLLTILVKRYGKFFSVVSGELNKTNMPSDLIYLAIAESYLNPRAVSKANAGGMWQFIKDTGKREGLCINDQIDERYSVTRSTASALQYLGRLHDEFGDWLVAMAAYNAGEARFREAIANQNTRDFFQLFLPEETNRYIYRIAAVKEIVGNPKKYGLPIQKEDYYRPYAVVEVTIKVEKETHTALLAQAMDLPYKSFREYNLHIRKYKLPRGVYHLYVPVEKRETFLKGIGSCPDVTLQQERIACGRPLDGGRERRVPLFQPSVRYGERIGCLRPVLPQNFLDKGSIHRLNLIKSLRQ